MCETCASDESFLLLHEAGEFLDSLLRDYLALPVEKALDLSTPQGFDRAVVLLAARLRQSSRNPDANAVRDALSVLDVDWRATTAEQRRRLIARAIQAAGKAVEPIVTAIKVPFNAAAESVVAATRQDARRRQGLAISADFNALDRRVARHIVRSQGNFVRDEYDRRLDDFGEQAKSIVASGLENGLGRDDIASDLRAAAEAAFVNRSSSYWDVIASAFVGQGRSLAQMSSYAEAGIRTYLIEAVLDEATTAICRFMHGKTFSVSDALARFDQIEQMATPEEIKQLMPWVRCGVDQESGRSVLYVNGTTGRVPLAEILRSGVGNRDDRGEFRAMAADEVLSRVGIGFPPFHGHCRSATLVA